MKDPNIAYPFMFSMNTGGARPKDLPSHYDGYDCRFTHKENNYDFYKEQRNCENFFEDDFNGYDEFKYKYEKADITDFGDPDTDYPYSVFGLKKSDSHEDMKKAYRSAILKAHPDKGGDADEFRFYQEAWQSYSI